MIRKAVTADVNRLAKTAMRAFANDPLMRWIMPDDALYEVELGNSMQRLIMTMWVGAGEVWTTDDCVSLAAWSPPDPQLTDELKGQIGAIRETFPADVLQRLSVLSPVLREHRPAEPHWYLNILATHPDWQRQGLGAAVMEPIRNRCDVEGLGQYLETATEADIAYYSGRGFSVRSRWILDGSVSMAGMWRDPGAGNH